MGFSVCLRCYTCKWELGSSGNFAPVYGSSTELSPSPRQAAADVFASGHTRVVMATIEDTADITLPVATVDMEALSPSENGSHCMRRGTYKEEPHWKCFQSWGGGMCD